MWTAALLLSALIGAPQTPAKVPGFHPQSVRSGCGFTSGARELFSIEVGHFNSEDRIPVADEYGQSVRVEGRWTHPDQSPHGGAAGRAWIEAHPTISFNGRDYERSGLPLVMGMNEVSWVAEVDGRAVTSLALARAPAVLYVLTEPTSCGFQRYELKD